MPRHDLEHQFTRQEFLSTLEQWVEFLQGKFSLCNFDLVLQTLVLDLLSLAGVSVTAVWECPVWPETEPGSAGSVPHGVRILGLISNACLGYNSSPIHLKHFTRLSLPKESTGRKSPLTVCLYTPVTSNFVNNTLLMQINSA